MMMTPTVSPSNFVMYIRINLNSVKQKCALLLINKKEVHFRSKFSREATSISTATWDINFTHSYE